MLFVNAAAFRGANLSEACQLPASRSSLRTSLSEITGEEEWNHGCLRDWFYSPKRLALNAVPPAHFDRKALEIPLAELFGGKGSVCLNHPRNAARPSRLVTGADASAVVAMEVFVEKDAVSPMRVGLEFLGAAKHRPAPRAVPNKCSD